MKRSSDAGMPLVETLAALAIVAAMASFSVLSLAGLARGADARSEALGLAARLQDAADAALTTSRRFVLEARSDGYAILDAPDPGTEGTGGAFARHSLPGAIRLATAGEAAPVPIGGAFARPFAAALRGGGETWTVRFDGLRATVTQEGRIDARD